MQLLANMMVLDFLRLICLSITQKKNNGARTEIITGFFESLYNQGLNNIQFFITDKDFAQISAAKKIWPNVKVQLCLLNCCW